MYDVVIVKPEYVTYDFNLDNIELAEKALMHKPHSEICPHLSFDQNKKAICAIHDMPWFKDTPCAAFTQIGKPDDNCRMGQYVLNNGLDFLVNVLTNKE